MTKIKTTFGAIVVASVTTLISSPSFAQPAPDCTPVECYRLALEKLQAAEDRAAAAEKALAEQLKTYQKQTSEQITAASEATLKQIRDENAPSFQTHNAAIKDLNDKVTSIVGGKGKNLVQGTALNSINGKTEAWCEQGHYLAGLKFYWSGTCKSQCNADGAILSKVEAVCRPLSGS